MNMYLNNYENLFENLKKKIGKIMGDEEDKKATYQYYAWGWVKHL